MPTPYHTPYQTLGGWIIGGVLHVPVVKIKAEREACAKIADERAAVWRAQVEGEHNRYPAECVASICDSIASVIRRRGETV